MKIFYAVQATGNGHISRAIQLMPYLRKLGEVDVFLSGSNATLAAPLPVQYRSRGLSLFYSTCGGLDWKSMLRKNSTVRALREARSLPVEKYDMVINDFEAITALACRIKKIPSVQFGHQASFISANTPRPATKSKLGEWVLKHYAPAEGYVGLHFKPYDSFIFPPVIKDCFLQAIPRDEGHVTVYLPAYERHCLEDHFRAFPHIHFHWFLKGIQSPERHGNITFFPVDNTLFNNSLLACHGIITGGGFETPAEALYLGKKLMCIPIRGQYEQRCNAAALQGSGVKVLAGIDGFFATEISLWLNEPPPAFRPMANNMDYTLQFLKDTYPRLHTSA